MKSKRANPILVVVFIAISFIMFLPFLILFANSLKSMGEIESIVPFINHFIPQTVHWDNYTAMWHAGDWPRFFYNTFVVSVLAVVISLIINSTAGYAFSRLHFKGRDVIFFLSLIAMLVPQQSSMIANFLILKNFPLAGGNNILGQGGKGFWDTFFGIMSPGFAGAFGVFLFRQYFLNFPKSLDDAARIDGLGRFGAFVRIYVPLSKPVFATLAIMKATGMWNDYFWPLVITYSPNMRTLQMALAMFKQQEQFPQWNMISAATCLIILPLLILFVFAQRYFVEGIVTSGMKG